MIDLNGKRNLFSKARRKDRPLHIFVILLLILSGWYVLRNVNTDKVGVLFQATPTPTRSLDSYAQEGETHFLAGNLGKAIEAYQNAVRVDPNNAELWTELARIQTYSTVQLLTDTEKNQRFQDAIVSINQAVALAPDDSSAHAVRAFIMDWFSTSVSGESSAAYLTEGEQEAVKALTLDPTNTLALAYYAEILIDQLKWNQAEEYILQAINQDTTLMDVHRVYAYVLESTRNYLAAIEEYKKAIEITPNLTFLYLAVGANYRALASPIATIYYDYALDYFAQASAINDTLGIRDATPLISIAKTYTQMGEFFSASRNMLKALDYNITNPDLYAQLGIVYFKARNYEGSIPALKCALKGCNEEEACEVRQCYDSDPRVAISGMPLSDNTLVYYFTYGSVLAAMHRPANNYCEEAMQVMAEIRASYSNDTTTMSIINESEAICMSYGYTRP
jgi:tetratricopeptide (TPR) repeat protein